MSSHDLIFSNRTIIPHFAACNILVVLAFVFGYSITWLPNNSRVV